MRDKKALTNGENEGKIIKYVMTQDAPICSMVRIVYRTADQESSVQENPIQESPIQKGSDG